MGCGSSHSVVAQQPSKAPLQTKVAAPDLDRSPKLPEADPPKSPNYDPSGKSNISSNNKSELENRTKTPDTKPDASRKSSATVSNKLPAVADDLDKSKPADKRKSSCSQSQLLEKRRDTRTSTDKVQASLPIDINWNLPSQWYSVADWRKLITQLLARKHLYEYAVSRSRLQLRSLHALDAFLSEAPTTSQLEQVWVVYLWVTHNIAYDGIGLRDDAKGKQDPNAVFQSGIAVCAGYASLLMRCCDGLGIPCREVSGSSRSTATGLIGKVGHAWSAVRVDGSSQWHLIDCTWGSGNIDDDYKFERIFKPYYFFVPPQVLINTHFKESFQLQPVKLTLEEFGRRNLLTTAFYSSGLHCTTYDVEAGPVNITGHQATLVFTTDDNTQSDLQLWGKLEAADGKVVENTVLVQRRGSCIEVSVICPEASSLYRLHLSEKSSKIALIKIEATATTGSNATQDRFCKTYAKCRDCYLVGPRSEQLQLHSVGRFRVWTRDVAELALIDAGSCFHKFVKSDEQLADDDLSKSHQLWALDHKFDVVGCHKVSYKGAETDTTFYTLYEYSVVDSKAAVVSATHTAYMTPTLRCTSHSSSSIESDANPFVLEFESNENLTLLPRLRDALDNNVEGGTFYTTERVEVRGKTRTRFKISSIVPKSMEIYKLVVFYDYSDDRRSKDGTFCRNRTYELKWVAQNKVDQRRYCDIYRPNNTDVVLYEPILRDLPESKPQVFRIKLPGALDAALIDEEGSWRHLSREREGTDVWVYKYTPFCCGLLKLSANYYGSTTFKTVCEYIIV